MVLTHKAHPLMTTFRARTSLSLMAGLVLIAAACGSDSDASTTEADSSGAPATGASSADDSQSAGEVVTVVVTTNILGDVVSELLDGQAEVITIMPVGADPHDFQASALLSRYLNTSVKCPFSPLDRTSRRHRGQLEHNRPKTENDKETPWSPSGYTL